MNLNSGLNKPAILWDMNGVLLDDEKVHEKCFAEVLFNFCGVDLTHEDYLEFFIGKTDYLGMKQYFESVESGVSPEVINNLCGVKNQLYIEYFSKGLAVNPKARDLLEDLDSQGFRQALVTCDQRPDVDQILKSMLPNVFVSTVAAQDVINSKPYAEPYLKAAELIGFDPSNCVVIEDTIAGVKSAKNAGAKVIGFCETSTSSYARQLQILGAGRVVNSLEGFTGDYFENFFDLEMLSAV